MESSTDKFSFTFINKRFESIDGKANNENLIKWGLKGKLKTYSFTYDKQFHLAKIEQFALDFFNDANALANVRKLSKYGSLDPIDKKVARVKTTKVECTKLSVDLFDRLHEKGIVRETGSIKKCLDDYYDGVLISDELRKMLLLEDSDNYEIYDYKERNEFLFRLFKHVCIGGEVCQFEDSVQPYVETAKSIYKDLINVVKDPESKALKIVSFVFQVEAFDESGKKKLYPNDTVNDQDFCYFIVDPFKRQLIVFYNSFEGPSSY